MAFNYSKEQIRRTANYRALEHPLAYPKTMTSHRSDLACKSNICPLTGYLVAGRRLTALEKKQNGTLAHKYNELSLRCSKGKPYLHHKDCESLKGNDHFIIHWSPPHWASWISEVQDRPAESYLMMSGKRYTQSHIESAV